MNGKRAAPKAIGRFRRSRNEPAAADRLDLPPLTPPVSPAPTEAPLKPFAAWPALAMSSPASTPPGTATTPVGTSFGLPAPTTPYDAPEPPYGVPAPPYGVPEPPYGVPEPPYGVPAPISDVPGYPESPLLDLSTPLLTVPDDAPVLAPSVLPQGAVPIVARALAAKRRKARRRRSIAALATLVVLALIAATVVIVIHNRHGKRLAPAVATSNGILLFQVTDANGATAVALLGDQHGQAGGVVLVPPQLAVDTADAGGMSLQAAALLLGNEGANGLADALGVQVDGTWTLTQPGLAALVDRVGGVDANVDEDVKVGGATVVSAGQQHLSGTAAAAWATYSVVGEPAAVQLARLDTVLEAVIAALPADPNAAIQIVSGLGPTSSATVPVEQVGTMLADLHRMDAANEVSYRSLPAHELDAGADTTYTIDTSGAAAVIRALTGSATGGRSIGDGIRVLVRNGVGTPGLGETTRAKLVKAGDTYIAGGNVTPFDKDPTVVLITEDNPTQRALGDKVAATLGLTDDSLRVADEGQSIADVVVVLGVDYHP